MSLLSSSVSSMSSESSSLRFAVLSYEQVKRLDSLMHEVVSIHGRGNFPTLEVELHELIRVVRGKLEGEYKVGVKEIRLNGSGASSVLAADFDADIEYNDLDLIFSVELASGRAYERVKCAVLDALLDLLPAGVSRKRMSSCSLKEAYVSKMVKVNADGSQCGGDRWSLITLGNNRSKSVELKFVDSMRRQYEFSVDSFQVVLDTLFLFHECSAMEMSDNFYPTVMGESMYGDFGEALFHLHKKLIATKNPEEIRGGGLLKYCNLLVKGYEPAWPEEVKAMERYMCSRFFIDFPDLHTQRNKLETYLFNHFQQEDELDGLKHDYLMILHEVVDNSTVCLMGHERRLTLNLIHEMAVSLSSKSVSHAPSFVYHGSDASSIVLDDPNLLSPMSMSDTASTCSSSSSSSSSVASNHKNGNSSTVGHVPKAIPTYEIITSCQPTVIYSNGFYYTSFIPTSNTSSSHGPSNTGETTVTMATLTSTSTDGVSCNCGKAAAVTPAPNVWVVHTTPTAST